MSVGRAGPVHKVRIGCSVSTTVAGNDVVTLVPVDSYVVGFAEDGGQFLHQPTGDIYDYDSCDSDAETVTLSAGLPTGKTLTAGDALYVYPRSDDYYTDVAIDDVADDVVSARIPESLRTIIEEGTKETGKGPLVRLQPGSEGWHVTELVGQEPTILANFPRLRLTNGTTSTAHGVTGLVIGWDAADIDTEGWWVSGTPSQIAPTYDCHALFIVDLVWAINATNRRALYVEESPDEGGSWTTVPALQHYTENSLANEPTIMRVAQMVPLSASKIYRVMRYQNSGAALNFNSARLTITVFGPS